MNDLLAKAARNPFYPVGRVNGRIIPEYKDGDFDSSSEEDPDIDRPYEQEFVEKEMKTYSMGPVVQSSAFDDVSTIGDLSLLEGIEGRTQVADVYRKYNFKLNADLKKELPIDSYRNQILSRIELNQVTVIEGPTGCGKTTQVPQMILDSYKEKNLYCNIVVTQPRKIATINVAKRVCAERGWTLGTVCGYQVGLEKKVSPDQIITYMTTGVLLQKLVRNKCLREYTHIIVDEIHERNQELDFLLLIVRKFLFTNSSQTKVVLMSATINADEFAFYFRKQISGQSIPAPIIKITKPSQHNITTYYLDQINIFADNIPNFDIAQPEITSYIWKVFIFLVNIFDKLSDTTDDSEDSVTVGSVLVFLPGINEIEEAHKLLTEENERRKRDGDRKKEIIWQIIPLHSSLPNDEQAKAFMPVPENCRKIILSTNIAESSVTVPDIRYVIDFCLTKTMTVDPVTKYMSLKLEWASHVNCNQRAGRVGRTCDGRVYRLILKEFYEKLDARNIPEILRAPLERIVLLAKMLDLNETPAQVLALAMKPPNLKNIETTICQLKEIGGLLKTCKGVTSQSDGDITFLGQVMASLPVDVHLSKMIVLGQLYSCLKETIIIAAGSSIQNIFSVPFQKRLDAYRKLLLWADNSCSDSIALLNLYTVYENLKRENAFENNKKELEWCQRNLVSLKGLREWQLLITEIKDRLERIQIKETMGPGKVHLSDAEKPTVLKVVMAGAFYPNYFIKYPEPDETMERDAVKTVGGRDPYRTVYFTGLDPAQPGQVYVRQIKKMIRERDEDETDIHIGFDGSMKIYIEFKNNERDPMSVNIDGFQRLTKTSSRVPRLVYEMIRKRQLNYKFVIKALPLDKAWAFAEKHGASKQFLTSKRSTRPDKNCYSAVDYNPLPGMDTQYIRITISNPIDPGHFWAQNADEKTNELLQQISEALNKQVLQQVGDQLKMGKVYATKFREDGRFYRCKLIAIGGRVNQVMFIDYGNIQEVRPEELFHLPQRPQCFVPPLAFECVMYGIKPAYRHNPLGMWNESINDQFWNWTSGILLYGEVYSVVNDVVELELYRNQRKETSINQHMICLGYAEPCNPSFLSKQNHDKRMAVQLSSNPQSEASRLNVDQMISYTDFAGPNIQTNDCIDVLLGGPYNPLETRLHCCTNSGSSKSVDIEGTSVNAVLLDSEPENRHSRLLVAAYVGQAAVGNKLKLRQTTLMPNVPGFPMMLSLLFCPFMEPKMTADNSLVAAVLCGLGYNEITRKSLYPSHDMELLLDTELTVEELEMINKLRFLMNNGIKLMHEMEQNRSTQKELLHTQIQIKDLLFKLINLERNPVDSFKISPKNKSWGITEGLGLLKPSMDNEENDIWPLLWFVKLASINKQQREINNNLEEINRMIYGMIPFERIICLLCNVESLFIHELRRHVISACHKQATERFNYSLNENDEDDEEDHDGN